MHFELKINAGMKFNKIIGDSGIDSVSYPNLEIFFILL